MVEKGELQVSFCLVITTLERQRKEGEKGGGERRSKGKGEQRGGSG